MTSILDHALALAAQGYSVIPLTPPDLTRFSEEAAGKKPLPFIVEWTSRPAAGEGQIVSWWEKYPDANVGIVTGRLSQIVCIDVDPRNGGLVWWSENMKDLLSYSPVVEESGRCDGGVHLYFRIPENFPLGSRDLAPGINFLADGRQVVTSPSVHAATGKPYTIKSELTLLDREFIPFLPESIKMHLTEIRLQKESRDARKMSAALSIRTCSDADKKKLTAQLMMLSGENGRHHTGLMWVINARAAGMDPRDIGPLVSAWMQDNGRDPQPNEIQNMIRDADTGLADGRFSPSMGVAKDFGFTPVVITGPNADESLIEEGGGISPELEAASLQAQEDGAWVQQLAATKEGGFKASRRNGELILVNDRRINRLFATNEMAQSIVMLSPPPWEPTKIIYADGTPLKDIDIQCFSSWMAEHYGFELGAQKALDAIAVAANKFRFHPVREYLEGLTWDGFPRLDDLLSVYFKAKEDPRYLAAVGSKWMLSAVARIFNPGCKADHVLVLKGPQGSYKSTALRILGGRWFSDDMGGEIGSRDSIDALRFAWLVEMPELHSFSKAQISQYTSFISRQVDRVRLSYGRCALEMPRGYVLSGTTNQDTFLRDETGNRRIWPVDLRHLDPEMGNRVDIDALAKDRNQIWAEAVVRFRKGEPWHIEDKEGLHSLVIAYQGQCFQRDEIAEPIAKWLDGFDKFNGTYGTPKNHVTMTQVWVEGLGWSTQGFDRMEQGRIRAVLRSLGWSAGRFSEGGTAHDGYIRGKA